jgi:hypothetical protein
MSTQNVSHQPTEADGRNTLPIKTPLDLPSTESRERPPTPQEYCRRAASAIPFLATLECGKEIHVSLFFDGTNNNMERDRPNQGHSNVVSLYDAHKNDDDECFRYYIPGVGTHFEEIGEDTELKAGKSMAKGGEARIHWGLLQLFNAVCMASIGKNLLKSKGKECEAGQWALKLTSSGKAYWDDFQILQNRLMSLIKTPPKKVITLHLSVFGFSRGAAEARTFCNWLQLILKEATGGKIGTALLQRVRFLGLFDTVASVGLADSSPVGDGGFMDWADGTMNVDEKVAEQVVHYVAAHEVRLNFPLSVVRKGGPPPVPGTSMVSASMEEWLGGAYAPNRKEFIYPGVHSDIGGGYTPGDQGKSTKEQGGRSALLSQIPLLDMYREAKNAGVRLKELDTLPLRIQTDFKITPALQSAFNAYVKWSTDVEDSNAATDKGDRAELRMVRHVGLYWRWRALISKASGNDRPKFGAALKCYGRASEQDKQDLWESEQDWCEDVRRAERAQKLSAQWKSVGMGLNPLNPVQKNLLSEIAEAGKVPTDAASFFDEYVHDSHGGFYMLGPVTKEDRQVMIEKLKKKKAELDHHTEAANEALKNQNLRGNMYYVYHMNQAESNKLNNYEQRVLDYQSGHKDQVPLMTDADAEDLADNAGWLDKLVVRGVLGSKTRREPGGVGHYRQVFDALSKRQYVNVVGKKPSSQPEPATPPGVRAGTTHSDDTAGRHLG